MATEFRSEVDSGGLDSNYVGGVIVECIADEAVPLWGPVILVAAGSGEQYPRVEPINTNSNVDVFGVAVDGEDNDGSNAVSAAGKKVKVMTVGRCKLKVDGTAAAIAIGDALVTDATDGQAMKADFSAADNSAVTVNASIKVLAAVFATALKASTTEGDIIPVYVCKKDGDTS